MSLTRAYLRAWQFYRDDRLNILFSLLLVGASSLANLAQPFPFAILVGLFDHEHSSRSVQTFVRLTPDNRLAQVLILAGGLFGLRLVSELISLAQGFLKIRIGYNGLFRVRCALFHHMQRLSIGFHKSQAQGDLIYRISSDTNGFVSAYNVVNGIVVNAVTLVLMAFIMFFMSWRLALVAVSITPFLFFAIRKYGGILTHTSKRATQIEAELATTVHRSVATIGIVQAYGREDDEYARFKTGVARSTGAWVRMHMQGMVYWLVLGLSFGFGAALILGYGGYLVHRGVIGVTPLLVFLQYVTAQLYGPLHNLSGSETELRRGLAGMLRVYEVLDTEPTIRDGPGAIDLPPEPRVITLAKVSFGYSPDAPVLRDVSVTIRPGEMVAFVGSSGAGKTSLLNLLPRFYDPTAGSIRLDAHDLRSIKLKDVRRNVAIVLQENPILSGTVAENIAYGNPQASSAQIRQAAVLAGAAGFIESLPGKFDAVLHEGGQNLSGGQRQRIAIARALATEAPVLIFDEPTSALDAHNEQMITQTLRDLKGKRTIILVSHRLSTVNDCDCIYVMEEGRIVEHGSAPQLISRGGVYARLARHQAALGGRELAPEPAQ